jgi:hypothetical protein
VVVHVVAVAVGLEVEDSVVVGLEVEDSAEEDSEEAVELSDQEVELAVHPLGGLDPLE